LSIDPQLKPIQRIQRIGGLALQSPAMDGRPHGPVYFFSVQVAEGVSLRDLVLPAVERMAPGQQALVVLGLGHLRGRWTDPLVRPAVVDVRHVWGRRGFEDQDLLVAAHLCPGLVDVGRRLQTTDLPGNLLQRGVGDILADDLATWCHPENHATAGAVEHGAEGPHARLQIARGLLELQALGLPLGNCLSQGLQIHQASVLIRALS
jgi:hypothetical protein